MWPRGNWARLEHDSGATWSDPPVIWALNRLINYPNPWTGKDGELHIIWTGEEEGKTALFFNRTIQGGTAWLPSPTRIDHPEKGPSPEQSRSFGNPLPPAWPAVSQDLEGRLFVAWEEKRESSNGIYFNRSLDQGVTWLPKDARLDRSAKIGRASCRERV